MCEGSLQKDYDAMSREELVSACQYLESKVTTATRDRHIIFGAGTVFIVVGVLATVLLCRIIAS